VAWLRNLDRKKWSLEIPYEVDGVTTSMFPDLVMGRLSIRGKVRGVTSNAELYRIIEVDAVTEE
jgi:hypothetical protein